MSIACLRAHLRVAVTWSIQTSAKTDTLTLTTQDSIDHDLDWLWTTSRSLPESTWSCRWSTWCFHNDHPIAEGDLPFETSWGTWASARLDSAECWPWRDPWHAATLDPSELTPPDWVHDALLELEHFCWAPHSWCEPLPCFELTSQLELPLHWRAEVLLPFLRWRWQLKLTTDATLGSDVTLLSSRRLSSNDDGLDDMKWKTMRIQVANRALNRIKVQRYWSLDCLVCLDCLDRFLPWACLLLWLMIAMIVTDIRLTFTNMTVICLTFLNIATESWYPCTMKCMTDMMNAMSVHHLLVAEAFWMTWFPESALEHQNDLSLDFRSLDEEVVVWKPYEFGLMLTWIAESLNPADFERLQSWSYKPDQQSWTSWIFQLELIFSCETCDSTSLEDLTIHECDDVHACDDILA